jgi:rhodanese-related sulfurtransferase
MMAFLMGLRSISPDAVRRLVEARRTTVIDVNGAISWAQAHVPGARHLDPTGFAESDLPPDKATDLVFYCSNSMCRKAPNAARRAKAMGYTSVRVMSAGIKGWVATGLPTTAGD